MAHCPTCRRELQFAQDGNPFCPDCSQREPERRALSIADYFRRFPATMILILFNVLVFVAMLFGHVSPLNPTADQITRWGGVSSQKILLANQWWRIISAAFIHIGALHLVVNMWALWVLGSLAEAVLGTYLYLGVYLVCAIAGFLASMYWNPFVVGAGASGALMGILGALVGVLRFARLPLPKEVLRTTIRSLVQGALLTLIIGLIPRIDNAAHVGGVICGLFIGLLLSLTRRADYTLQRPLRLICLIAPFALMVPLALAVQKHGKPWLHFQKAQQELGAQHYQQAEKEARIALRQLPKETAILECLSEALFLQGNDAEAGKYLRELIGRDPRNTFALNRLAAIELKEGDAIGARDLLSKTLPLQPQNAYGYVYLGRALQVLNQDKEAIAQYRQAVQISPDLYEAQLALAGMYEKHNEPQNAVLFYLKAAQLRPNDLEPLRGLARSYLAAGMKQQADQNIAEIRKREQGTASRE